jgi:KTSC domain
MNTTRAPRRRHIPTTPVESSAISAVGHDPQTNTLRVEFSSGGVYDIANVSAQEHQSLTEAASPGSFYHKNFRGRAVSKV